MYLKLAQTINILWIMKNEIAEHSLLKSNTLHRAFLNNISEPLEVSPGNAKKLKYFN
jgi:hypothetical protein